MNRRQFSLNALIASMSAFIVKRPELAANVETTEPIRYRNILANDGVTITAGDPEAKRIEAVFVDGVKIEHCLAFNVKHGWADVYDLDAYHRNLYTDSFPQKRLHGTISYRVNPFA